MAESDTTATAEVEATTAASTETTEANVTDVVTQYLNPDGTFKDGWQSLAPEDFRGRTVYKGITGIKDLLKQVGHQASLIGRQGKGIVPPPADASPTEIEMFYEALGRPKTPTDYKVDVPKEMESFYDKTMLSEALSDLHKVGLTQKQVEAVMSLDAKRLKASVEASTAAATAQREAVESSLRAKWGNAFEERLHIANRVISENVAEADRPALLEAIGNNAVVAELLANVGKKFTEGKLVNTDAASTKATPAEAKLKASEIAAELAREGDMKWNNPAKYARLNKELTQNIEASLAGQG